MSRDSRPRKSRSESPSHDEEDDYQLALRLSAELYGGRPHLQSATPSKVADYEDEDFKLALEMHSADSGTSGANGTAAVSSSGQGWQGASSFQKASPWAGKNEPKTIVYHTETASGKIFTTLTELIAHVREAQCSKCGWRFFGAESDVSKVLMKWRDEKSTTLSSDLTCIQCSASSCITCKQGPFTKHSFISAYGRKISWCCSGGRLLLLWLLSCGFDEHFSAVKLKEATKPSKEVGHNKKGKKKLNGVTGVGFGGPRIATSYMPGGLGYASDMFDDDYSGDSDSFTSPFTGHGHTLSGRRFAPNVIDTASKAKALDAQHTEDQFNTLFLGFIEGLLPSFDRESSFDFDPPETVAQILIESKLLSYCTELLRNDSLEETTKRKDLYNTLIGFIRTCGAHYVTAARTVFGPRPLREDKTNLVVLSFSHTSAATLESGASLFDNLGNLNTQSALVLQGAKSNEQDFRTEEGQNLLLVCRQISDLYRYLVANSGSSQPVINKTKISAVLELPDDKVMQNHYYASAAKSLQSTLPGRFKRLITELTTLKTGLPPGIFVRYAESRPDVQKVVIIGPVGTPYENGVFEFDFFCDGNFPNKPPLVQFKTTGGGRVHFNPNLYPDGKVCLSLLGTWPGEPWAPSESTLLQVLISFQAMILTEEPWYNEPGREAAYQRNPGNGPTAAYNQKIRQHTVGTAMLPWLDEPSSPLWKDVIDQHFTENANKILQNYNEWSKKKYVARVPARYGVMEDDNDFYHGYEYLGHTVVGGGGPARHETGDLTSMLPRLQKLLQKYGATPIVKSAPQPSTPRVTRSRTAHPPVTPQPLPHTPHTLFPPSMMSSFIPQQQPTMMSPFTPQQPSFMPPYMPQQPSSIPPYMPQQPSSIPPYIPQNPSVVLPPYMPPSFVGDYPPPPPFPDFGFGRGFMGPGRVLGNGPSEQAGDRSTPSNARGGYSTRSTRGRGEGDGSRGRSSGRGLGPRGGRGGGSSQDRGRGGRGGSGESGGYQ